MAGTEEFSGFLRSLFLCVRPAPVRSPVTVGATGRIDISLPLENAGARSRAGTYVEATKRRDRPAPAVLRTWRSRPATTTKRVHARGPPHQIRHVRRTSCVYVLYIYYLAASSPATGDGIGGVVAKQTAVCILRRRAAVLQVVEWKDSAPLGRGPPFLPGCRGEATRTGCLLVLAGMVVWYSMYGQAGHHR